MMQQSDRITYFTNWLQPQSRRRLHSGDPLQNTDNGTFTYIGFTDTTVIQKESDGKKLQTTIDALALFGISGKQIKDLMQTFVLYFGLETLRLMLTHKMMTVLLSAPRMNLRNYLTLWVCQ